MICPACKEATLVIMTRKFDTVVFRTRQCRRCGTLINTEETACGDYKKAPNNRGTGQGDN